MTNFSSRSPIDADAARELIEELELSEAVSVQKLREQAPSHITADVVVRPADLSDRGTVEATGKAREFQKLGVTAVLDHPLLPGRVLYLTFAADNFEIRPLLAVCDRCAVLAQDAFEVHFQFLQPQELTELDDVR